MPVDTASYATPMEQETMKHFQAEPKRREKILFRNGRSIIILIALLLVSVTSAASLDPNTQLVCKTPSSQLKFVHHVPRGGGWIIPSGWHPFAYKVTKLGEAFLQFGGSLDSDVGRLLSSLKKRKRWSTLKSDWLEVLRVSKTTQSIRIYRTLKDLLDFCLKAGLID